MRKHKFVETIIKAKRIESIKCDFCGKEIVGKFWVLTTSHGDWGNDSVESIQHFDICSPECLDNALYDYIERCKHSHTQCFELEQNFFGAESEDKNEVSD